MKHLFSLTTAALALTLTACGSKDVIVLPADTVGLRITSEVPAGLKADRISVMPNDVAPWLSQILLLSDGKLYRTSATGGKAQGVNGGNLKDMIGLMRKGDAGTILTLTRDGKLTAMIEKDDEGRLARMNVSAKAESYDGFCQGQKAPTTTVTAFTRKALVTLKIDYEGSDLMTVTETARVSLSKPITSCFVSGDTVYAMAGGQLNVNGVDTGSIPGKTRGLSGISSAAAPAILYVEDANMLASLRSAKPSTRRKVVIQDGLSVPGTQNISSIYTTADSLGGTFSGGAVIAQDANAERLILVSLPFAKKTLSKQTVTR